MPKTLKILHPEKVKREIEEYLSSNEDARFVRRLDAILLVLNGFPARSVACLFGVNPTTVQRWVHLVNNFGIEGLRDKPGRGRPSRLCKSDQLKLKEEIQKEPSEFGYDQARWDGKLLSYHLRTRYGVELKVRQCQNLFRQLGFSLKRPRKMPVGGDPDKRDKFKKNSRGSPS